MKNFKKIIIIICLAAALALPGLVLAQDLGPNPPLKILDEVGGGTGPYQTPANSQAQLLEIVGVIVGIALGLVGAVFLILMILAGYNWMTAQGEEEKVQKAKDTITRAIIGIIIVIGAYASWAFLFSKLF